MKKISFIVFLLITSLGYSQAKFGIKGGNNLSNITEVHSFSKTRVGFHIGFLSRFNIDEERRFFVQPEIQYSQLGERNKGGGYDEVYRFDYISVPVMLRYDLFKEVVPIENGKYDKYSIVFIELGPQVGVLLNDNTKLNIGTVIENPTEEYQNLDFSVGAGFGFAFSEKFEMSARYYLGMIDAIDKDFKEATNRTSVIQLGATFLFN